MNNQNKLEPIDCHHRLGKYYIENACWQGQLPCAHYVIDSETGIRTKLTGIEIYDIVKSNPEFEYMHEIKYSHFDYCPLLNRELLNPIGYTDYKEEGFGALRLDLMEKEPQEARDKRTEEYKKIIIRERALVDYNLCSDYRERMDEKLEKQNPGIKIENWTRLSPKEEKKEGCYIS